MTTYRAAYPSAAAKRPPNSTGAFLFTVLILVLAVIAVWNVPLIHQAASPPRIYIQGGSDHGDYAHGDEGEQARNCLEQHGTGILFREHNGNTFHFLCQNDMGEWFDVVAARKDDAHFVEKSAYAPDEQTINEIEKWLRGGLRLASEFKEILWGTPVTITK